MRFGVIAEGHADIDVIKAVLKALKGIDGSEVRKIRPSDQYDETDLHALNFSNWTLVLESCQDKTLLSGFFDMLQEDALLIVQIDTAERTEQGYDTPLPLREKNMDWSIYSESVYQCVRERISLLIPEEYRKKVAFAIAVEETDAWLIPLFDNLCDETARYANPKEKLRDLIGKLGKKEKSKYIDSNKKNLNYMEIGKGLKKKGIKVCRSKNKSLDLFCLELDQKINE